MHRKRLVFSLLGVAVVGAGLLTASFYFRASNSIRIDQESTDRIQPGMTRAEVEAIIGGPPGDYTKTSRADLPPSVSTSSVLEDWQGPSGSIVVEFDREGIVLDSYFIPRDSPWQCIRRFMGLKTRDHL